MHTPGAGGLFQSLRTTFDIMLNWLFKKRVPASASKPIAVPAPPVQSKADIDAKKTADARVLWLPQLQSAQGDDSALLQIALTAPLLEIKLAAVEALVSEAALKQAEREFRSHDRRAHQAAKRRLLAAVAEREARTCAAALIETARALTRDELLPANLLVSLDRDWQALSPGLLTPEQGAEFSDLRNRLNAALRDRAEHQQRLQRWSADATQALADLRLACADAAAGAGNAGTGNAGTGDDLAARRSAALVLLATRPDAPSAATIEQALQAALQIAEMVETRVAFLVALAQMPVPAVPMIVPSADVEAVVNETATEATPVSEAAAPADSAEAVEPALVVPPVEAAQAEAEVITEADVATAEPATQDITPTSQPEIPPVRAAPAPTPVQRWRDLPPLADGELARVLNQRFDEWQRAQIPARQPKATARVVSAAPKAVKTPKAPSPEQVLRLDTLLQQAESALADGQMGEVQQQLQHFNASLESMSGVVADESLHVRYQALQAEMSRLEGWRQWGGGRALDDLVDEAEQLARSTLESADPEATHAPKLHLKTHGEAIHAMRARWRNLQQLGGAPDQSLWHRFDTALQTAHQPLAAQQAALKADRDDNLLAREALLVTLDAVPAQTEFVNTDEQAAYWKEQMRSLERFQLAWRQLGPVEHTVPHAARNALQQHLRNSIGRVEMPLREARRAAEAVREQLIARAETLVAEAADSLQMRDAAARVREIQAEWGNAARTLPLARGIETTLWGRFKAATDAVFAQRDAVFNARDAELTGNLSAREELLGRLSALGDDSPAVEIQRVVAECDRAWSQAVEVPRSAAASIDARFGDARAAAMQILFNKGKQRWQGQCDTIAAKLALCDDRESGRVNDEELASRWAAQTALPPALEQALAQRWSQPAGEPAAPIAASTAASITASGTSSESVGDDLLLQLEMALDLPGSPEWQAARRERKLRAMKSALEGRGPSNPVAARRPARPAELLAAALGQGGASSPQRQRLREIVAALRVASPEQLELLGIRD